MDFQQIVNGLKVHNVKVIIALDCKEVEDIYTMLNSQFSIIEQQIAHLKKTAAHQSILIAELEQKLERIDKIKEVLLNNAKKSIS